MVCTVSLPLLLFLLPSSYVLPLVYQVCRIDGFSWLFTWYIAVGRIHFHFLLFLRYMLLFFPSVPLSAFRFHTRFVVSQHFTFC